MSNGITIPASSIGAGSVMGMSNYGAGALQTIPTSQPSFLSGVGNWFAQNPALAMGIGAMGMMAGSTGPSAPSAKIKLTKKGEELETRLYKSIKGAGYPDNLIDPKLRARLIGETKRTEQERQRISGRMITAGTAGGAVSGNVARAFLTETQSRLKGAQEGPLRVGEAKRGAALGYFSNLLKFMGEQLQTPVRTTEADLTNKLLAQQRAAGQGAALGGIAQLLATSHVYGGRS